MNRVTHQLHVIFVSAILGVSIVVVFPIGDVGFEFSALILFLILLSGVRQTPVFKTEALFAGGMCRRAVNTGHGGYAPTNTVSDACYFSASLPSGASSWSSSLCATACVDNPEGCAAYTLDRTSGQTACYLYPVEKCESSLGYTVANGDEHNQLDTLDRCASAQGGNAYLTTYYRVQGLTYEHQGELSDGTRDGSIGVSQFPYNTDHEAGELGLFNNSFTVGLAFFRASTGNRCDSLSGSTCNTGNTQTLFSVASGDVSECASEGGTGNFVGVVKYGIGGHAKPLPQPCC